MPVEVRYIEDAEVNFPRKGCFSTATEFEIGVSVAVSMLQACRLHIPADLGHRAILGHLTETIPQRVGYDSVQIRLWSFLPSSVDLSLFCVFIFQFGHFVELFSMIGQLFSGFSLFQTFPHFEIMNRGHQSQRTSYCIRNKRSTSVLCPHETSINDPSISSLQC
jgi:hypothetical protein